MPLQWRGIYKKTSTISIVSSPELDIALATVCFLARKDYVCPLAGADGTLYAYQTFSIIENGVTYIETAYATQIPAAITAVTTAVTTAATTSATKSNPLP